MNYEDCISFLKDNVKDPKEISILKKIELKFGPEAVLGTLTNGKDLVYENNLYKHLKTREYLNDTRINFGEEGRYEDFGYIYENTYTYPMAWMKQVHQGDSYLFGDLNNILTSIVCINVGEYERETHLEGNLNINITDGTYTDDMPNSYECALGDWTQPIYPWGKELVTGINKSVKNNVKRYKNFFSLVCMDYGLVQINKPYIEHPFDIPKKRVAESFKMLIMVVQRKSSEINTGKFKLSCAICEYNNNQSKWLLTKYFVNKWYQTPHWTKNLQVFWEWIKLPNGHSYTIDNIMKQSVKIIMLPPDDGEILENFKPFYSKIQMEN